MLPVLELCSSGSSSMCFEPVALVVVYVCYCMLELCSSGSSSVHFEPVALVVVYVRYVCVRVRAL